MCSWMNIVTFFVKGGMWVAKKPETFSKGLAPEKVSVFLQPRVGGWIWKWIVAWGQGLTW